MKKSVILFSLIGLLLSSCSIRDIFGTKENQDQKHDSNNQQPSENQGEDNQGENQGGGTTPTTINVSSIKLNKNETSIEEMQNEKLTYTISPSNATNKNVEWSTSNGTVASVIDGTVYANNPGIATITITTEDGNKTDSCLVTVTKKESISHTVTKNLVFNDLGFTNTVDPFNGPINVDENIVFTASVGSGTIEPRCMKGPNTKKYEFRPYQGNTFTFTSSEGDIKKIEMTFSTDNPGVLPITSNVPSFDTDTWTGSATSVTFSVDNSDSGHRRISAFAITYEGEEPAPEELVNLGEKSIAEVKQYIADHPVQKNDRGNGVNEYRVVTIKGFALAKIDLVKTLANFGLNVSQPGKVIMADSTDSIAVASKVDGQGTCLWGKVGDHTCEPTSKYIVTGYVSEYLGHPEIMVTSFSWDKDLDISWNPTVISKATTDLACFYTRATAVDYNCAGHGYGDVITINNLKCYYVESDGSGKRYYNFTDGLKNIRVNAYNLNTISVGSICNITGIISLKNLSPIIIAFKIAATTDPTTVTLDYQTVAQDITIKNLKVIHGSQADTASRYDNVVNAYGTFYKTTGYLTVVEENGKLYVGISDTYIERKDLINGKDNAMANYGISLIKNENFWNTTEEELYLFNPTFDDYILEDNPITVYYVVRQQRFMTNKPMWEILLLPDFIESLKPAE